MILLDNTNNKNTLHHICHIDIKYQLIQKFVIETYGFYYFFTIVHIPITLKTLRKYLIRTHHNSS